MWIRLSGRFMLFKLYGENVFLKENLLCTSKHVVFRSLTWIVMHSYCYGNLVSLFGCSNFNHSPTKRKGLRSMARKSCRFDRIQIFVRFFSVILWFDVLVETMLVIPLLQMAFHMHSTFYHQG